MAAYDVSYSSTKRVVRVAIHREPADRDLKRMETDIRKLDGYLSGRRGIATLRFELGLPLSRHLATFVSDLSQRLELTPIVSIPPIVDPDQRVLAHEMAAASHPSFRIEVRPA